MNTKTENLKGLHHIIFISFRPEAPEPVREDIYSRYQTLAEDCGGEEAGILLWTVKKNRDVRKNIHLIEFAVFRDEDCFHRFKEHQKHQELLQILKEHADWHVGDFVHE